MRKLILTAMSALTAMCANAAYDGQLRIKAAINGCDTLIVCIQNPGHTEPVDTMIAKDGRMETTITLDAVKGVILGTPAFARGERFYGELTVLTGIPGETVELSGDLTLPHFGGSPFYEQMGEMREALRPQMQARMDLETFIEDGKAKGVSEEELVKQYKELEPRVLSDLSDGIIDFISHHPDNEAIPDMLYSLGGIEKMEKAAAMMGDKAKNGPLKERYEAIMADMKSSAQKQAQASIPQGEAAPDFTLGDINGKPLALSSLKGKYVLLDFWGSWCGACIKGFPQLRVNYKKYAGRLEVVGIDCGDTEDKWKEAVKEHDLPWLQVYHPRNATVTADYKVNAFPTKVLIGPDGKVIKYVVGEDSTFYDDFDSLLGK